ncbi:hypothetical protein [Shimia sp.]|uniref:hypothetical protein n=1 Tax=Shimia sp. TaxID=1954381 RepID=UPI003298B316
MKNFWGIALILGLVGPVQAESVWDKVKKGAQTTGEAIGDGAQAVGGAVESGAEAVGDAFVSTGELVSNEATPADTRARLDAMADDIIARLISENAEARELFEISAGYAAFDSRQVSVIPVSAAYGRGVAISLGNGARTYMNMGSGGVGLAIGIGGFAKQFVILFETQADFESFVAHGYDASAEAGSMQGEGNSNESVRFVDGRSFFALSKKGWRVNANASGTKYWRSPELN